MNEYLFMIIVVTNPQITQQSRIDNTSNSDLETSDPLKND